jgi:inner membrane protein
MMFKTHLIVSLLAYVVLIKFLSFDFSWLFLGALLVGSIVPDLDHPTSFISKKIKILKPLDLFVGHRGIFHSIFGMAFIALVVFIVLIYFKLPLFFLLAISLGYFLHLFADSFTPAGIKWFWKSFHIRGPIRTSGIMEHVLLIALILLTVYIYIGHQGVENITAFATKFFQK